MAPTTPWTILNLDRDRALSLRKDRSRYQVRQGVWFPLDFPYIEKAESQLLLLNERQHKFIIKSLKKKNGKKKITNLPDL